MKQVSQVTTEVAINLWKEGVWRERERERESVV